VDLNIRDLLLKKEKGKIWNPISASCFAVRAYSAAPVNREEITFLGGGANKEINKQMGVEHKLFI
jgi:hypothetical protein